MSRPIPADQETSLERIADALTRVADTFDDYMDITLAGIELAHGAKGNPAIDEMLRPMLEVLTEIKDRRSVRS